MSTFLVAQEDQALIKQMIANGEINPPIYEGSFPGIGYELRPASADACNPDTDCFIEPDSTHVLVDFSFGYFPGGGCDDCTSETTIPLNFDYSICGNTFNEFWINSNGNITFINGFTPYTPVGIPNSDTEIMVAPLWCDVDLVTCGQVFYKIEPNRVIVTWLDVGFYLQNCSLLNTFQVILTDGTDPDVGLGNNTSFRYKDCNWTTGDASDGVNGFPDPYGYAFPPGNPAIAGINANDGVLFDLIGEFDTLGLAAPIVDATGSLEAGGIDWLDFKCFNFAAGQCAIDSVCSMTDLDIIFECVGNDFEIVVDFDIEFPASDGFIVSLGTEEFGPFDYNQNGTANTVTIPGTGSVGDTISISVNDLISPSCFVDECIEIPLCQINCAQFLFAQASSSNICSGEAIEIIYDVDQFANNTEFSFVTADGPVDPSLVLLMTDGCLPEMQQIYVTAQCSADSAFVLYDTIDVVVFPSNIDAFVEGNNTGGCDVGVTVAPGCEDVIVIGEIPIVDTGVGTVEIEVAYIDTTVNCIEPFLVASSYACFDCELFDLEAVPLACAEGNFMLSVNVAGADLSDSFTIEIDGANVGTFNYADLPIEIGPYAGDGSTYEIVVTDSAASTCNAVAEFGPVECICDIQGVDVSLSSCDNGTYSATINVFGDDFYGDFNFIDENGDDFGTFNANDFPITLDGFVGDNATIYKFDLIGSAGCVANVNVGPQDCLCEITDYTVVPLDCDGENFSVEVNLSGTNLYGDFSIEDQFANIFGTYSADDFPVTVGPLSGDFLTAYTISAINSIASCEASITLDPVDCLPCAINGVTATPIACDGLEYSIEINIDAENTGETFTLTNDNGDIVGVYNYSDLPIVVGPYIGDNATEYTFTVTDDENTDCSASATSVAQGCYVCDSGNLLVNGSCNGSDLATFDVYISFTGSNTYTVTDGDGTVLLSGISSGQDIFVGAYPNNAEVDIIVSDELVADCEITGDVACVLCDPALCNSQDGTIMASQTVVCPGGQVIVDADDFLLMPKQSVFYIYHNQETVSYSDLPDLVNDVYETGSFLVNNNMGIDYGTVVYVTAIGAMEDHNMPGFPDYDDICLTVSNTIPIYFLAPVVIGVTEYCDNSTGEFTYNFAVSGGTGDFFPTVPYTITGDQFDTVLIGDTISVGPITDGEFYNIIATDDNGCTAEIDSMIFCEKLPIELLSFTGEVQAEGNNLKWVTASEINNDYFTVERSSDGAQFEALTFVTGAGTTSILSSYEFLDKAAPSGLSYYRIKQTDFDGTYAYTYVITLTRGESTQINLLNMFPQPATDFVNIAVSSPSDSESTIVIYNAIGSVVYSETYHMQIGLNEFDIELNNLADGLYLLNITSGDVTINEKLIVEK